MLFAVSLLLLCTGISVSADLQCTIISGKLTQIDAGAGEVYGVNSNDDIFRWVDNTWQSVSGKLMHVSVGPAGVWGVNRDNNIFKLQDNKWMSISGLLKQVDAGGNKYLGGVNAEDGIFCLRQSCTVSRSSAVTWTKLDGDLKYYSCGLWGCWGVNKPNDIFFRHNVNPTACQGTQWQKVGGSLVMIEVGTDGSVYGVNSAGNVLRSSDFQCTIIPGKLRQIDAGAGEVYGVNKNDDIFHWVDNTWIQIPGKLTHVSVGPAGVWGVNKANIIYKLQDNEWVSISGLLKQVDSGGNKFLAGVNAQDKIYCLRRSCTVSRSSVVHFTPLDGSLKYYSCGPIGCWGVNSADNIYFRHNVKPTSCLGSKWQQIDGALAMIEVGTDGSVYGVNSAGIVYRREGISAETPTGTFWTELDFCATFKHVTYDNGYLWLLNPTGDIYRCVETQDQVQQVQQFLV